MDAYLSIISVDYVTHLGTHAVCLPIYLSIYLSIRDKEDELRKNTQNVRG